MSVQTDKNRKYLIQIPKYPYFYYYLKSNLFRKKFSINDSQCIRKKNMGRVELSFQIC